MHYSESEDAMERAKAWDTKARGLAKEYQSAEGALLLVLMQMRKDSLFAELGYSGIFSYCEQALGFSREQSYYFKAVAEKAEAVPELKEAVVQGELSISKARRIVSVLDSDNQAQWIEDAKQLSQKELEKKVADAKPEKPKRERLRPIGQALRELKVPLDEGSAQSLEVLKELLSQKMGKPASLKEALAWAIETTREKYDPERRAQRASQRKVSLGNTAPLKPGRHPIRKSTRHAVIRREGYRCCHRGPDGTRCTETRWLSFHHRKEVCEGGLNTADNLELRCFAHHALQHRDQAWGRQRSA